MSVEKEAIDLGEHRRRRGGAPPIDDPRPVITCRRGQLRRQIDEAEAALVKANDGLYRYGERLVHVEWDVIKVAGGDTSQRLASVRSHVVNIMMRLEGAARFEKWNVRNNDFVTCSCPEKVARGLLDLGSWKLPPLLGVVTAPTLRPDGSVIDK